MMLQSNWSVVKSGSNIKAVSMEYKARVQSPPESTATLAVAPVRSNFAPKNLSDRKRKGTIAKIKFDRKSYY